jgi:diguanylate cyclase (GGDEF)-like protein/PAS domain S-box-containing protein
MTVLEDTATNRALLEHIGAGAAICTADGTFLFGSAAFASALGKTDEELARTELLALVHPDDANDAQRRWANARPDQPAAFTPRIAHGDGTWHWMSFDVVALAEHNRRLVIRREAPSDAPLTPTPLLQQVRYDTVTGLPNRVLFLDRLGRAVERAQREPGYVCAVLFLDIDRFKIVNDSFGHSMGDQLLRIIAQRLTSALRAQDTIARLGSDEFGMLINGVADVAEVQSLAERLHELFVTPLDLNRHEIVFTVSVGIAINEGTYADPEALLRDADTALHRAKTMGKARSEVFDRGMQAQVMHLLRLESELRSAVWHEVLQLHYQPIVSVGDGRLIGVEALIRWHHPERGFVSPAEFIPLAEETGLIVPMGAWVLRSACLQAKAWEDAGLGPLYVSVNLSARQFKHNSVPDLVRQTVEDVAIAPEGLKLELTESSVMENAEVIIPALYQIRSQGIELAMDDFGTGYSSLSNLKRLPLSTLKIDRSFVRDMDTDAQNIAIVRATIAMAHSLGLFVIVEGVETTEQCHTLVGLGCDAIQGYLASRPVPADQITSILQENRQLLPL